jgi:hypothetical protein
MGDVVPMRQDQGLQLFVTIPARLYRQILLQSLACADDLEIELITRYTPTWAGEPSPLEQRRLARDMDVVNSLRQTVGHLRACVELPEQEHEALTGDRK